MPKVVYRYANKCFFGNLRVEDKFGRRRPMFLPIYHGQTSCRISIERLAMGKGSLICVPSLRRLYLPGPLLSLDSCRYLHEARPNFPSTSDITAKHPSEFCCVFASLHLYYRKST